MMRVVDPLREKELVLVADLLPEVDLLLVEQELLGLVPLGQRV